MSEYNCKVCRTLDKHGLNHYEKRMVDRWTASGSQRKGYRTLARELNIRVLQDSMDRAGLETLGGEAESKYERLTGDSPRADEVKRILQQEGVPISSLMDDFVSYGVVRTHLQDCLDLERETSHGDWESDALEITTSMARSKAHEAISSLLNSDRLQAGGEVNVHATIEVECENCHTRVPVQRALRRGYVCKCKSNSEQEGINTNV